MATSVVRQQEQFFCVLPLPHMTIHFYMDKLLQSWCKKGVESVIANARMIVAKRSAIFPVHFSGMYSHDFVTPTHTYVYDGLYSLSYIIFHKHDFCSQL